MAILFVNQEIVKVSIMIMGSAKSVGDALVRRFVRLMSRVLLQAPGASSVAATELFTHPRHAAL